MNKATNNKYKTALLPRAEGIREPLYGVAFYLSSGRSFALTLCQQSLRMQRLSSRHKRAHETVDAPAMLDWVELYPDDDRRLQFRYTGFTRATESEFLLTLKLPERVEIERLLQASEVMEFEEFSARNRQDLREKLYLNLLPVSLCWQSHLVTWLNAQSGKRQAGQWLAEVQKLPGVCMDEKYWSGLLPLLAAREPENLLSAHDLLAHIDFSPVQPTVYCAMGKKRGRLGELSVCKRPLTSSEIAATGCEPGHAEVILYHPSFNYRVIRQRLDDLLGHQAFWLVLAPGNILLKGDDDNYLMTSVQECLRSAERHHNRYYGWRTAYGASEKWLDYATEGGEKYREWLALLEAFPLRYTQGKHFQVSNLLLHIRTSEHITITGKRVLFIEEIQSDWLQKRDNKQVNYASPDGMVRRMPWFHRWYLLAVNIAMYLAAKDDCDGIALVTGEMLESPAFPDEGESGLCHLYDGMVGRYLRRLSSQWDTALTQHAIAAYSMIDRLVKAGDGYSLLSDDGELATRPLAKTAIRRYQVAKHRDALETVPGLLFSPELRAAILESGVPLFGGYK